VKSGMLTNSEDAHATRAYSGIDWAGLQGGR
jgi:hypothetical protein